MKLKKLGKKNNVDRMNILRHSIKNLQSNTLKILNLIYSDDNIIFKLFKKLNEK